MPFVRRPIRIGSLVVLLAVASLASSAAAQAAEFSFVGRGFGHGVGLSQYGAHGAALRGWSEARIVKYYYPGTALTRVAPADRRVRVLLGERRLRVRLVASRRLEMRGADGARLRLSAGAVTIERDGDSATVTDSRGRTGRVALPARATSPRPLSFAGAPYRGRMELHARGAGRLDLVNDVGLEAYLAGVVPKEVPAEWATTAPAAVRAQAIVARSYALGSRRRSGHFQLFADTRSQVYGGLGAEDPRTRAAVRATAGRVVTYEGAVVTAFFFSTSGGRTESAANVWGNDVPYLVSRRDPFDRGSPYHRWPEPVRVSGEALAEALELDAPIADVRVLRRGTSPRVRLVRVTTEDGAERTLSGAEVQAAAGLRSTWFSVRRMAP